MRCLATHLWKEWRDQRAVLLGILVALPVLTALAFWAFADRLVEADEGLIGALALPVALAILFFAVGGDLFAGEGRRRTLAFLRRTPHGLGYAFLAKVTLLGLAAAAVVVWQALALVLCWTLWGRSSPAQFTVVVSWGFAAPWVWLVLLVGAWILLASTWLQHGGMASLLGPLLLALVLAPAVVWVRANVRLARWLADALHLSLPGVILWLAVIALVGSALSFLRGRAVERPAWSAAWRGLLVVVLLGSGTYAYGAWRADRLLALEPGSDAVQLETAWLARGGRTLYVTAVRVAGAAENRVGAPRVTWQVDVATGAWRRFAGRDAWVAPPALRLPRPFPGSPGSALEPLPVLVARDLDLGVDASGLVGRYFDADSGEVLKTLPLEVSTPETEGWEDEAGRTATWLRDAEGRRVWVRGSGTPLLCGEGREPRPLGEGRHANLLPTHMLPGGLQLWKPGGALSVLQDLGDGTLRGWPRRMRGQALSPRRVLASVLDAKGVPTRWEVHDLDDGTTREPTGLVADAAQVVEVLEADRVLLLAGHRGPKRLVCWDPVVGETVPIDWHGLAPEGLQYAWIVGRRADGVALLSATTLGGWALYALDPRVPEARRLGPLAARAAQVFAFDPDGAAWVVESSARIVRRGPGPEDHRVVLPH